MAELPRRMLFRATPVISSFLILPLLYGAFCGKEQQSSWSWRRVNNGLEEGVSLKFLLRRLLRGEERKELEATGFACHSDLHSDLCVTNQRVIVDTKSLTIYIPNSHRQTPTLQLQPYARKEDETAMQLVTPLHIFHSNTTPLPPPPCHDHQNHNVPVVIFSSGGFTGNIFHEFNEVIIPLFITTRHFHSQIRFIITDLKPWFVTKYTKVLSQLSRYEIISSNLKGNNVHCFLGAVMGLMYHENLALNYTEIPKGYSMLDFKKFLRASYSLKIENVREIKRPVLVLISRRKTRVFLNEDAIVGLIEELGFRVVVTTPKRMLNLEKFAKVVNSCSVMVGAHGAGLTNELFLPDGAVMVQVVPLGLDWASNAYYGGPAEGMGLRYMRYNIEANESSLTELYGRDHPVVVDPMSVFSKGYRAARAVYIDGQNMRINLVRFRKTLIEALKIVAHSG